MATQASKRADALLAEARRVLNDLAGDGGLQQKSRPNTPGAAGTPAGHPQSPNRWHQLSSIAKDQAAVDLHLLTSPRAHAPAQQHHHLPLPSHNQQHTAVSLDPVATTPATSAAQRPSRRALPGRSRSPGRHASHSVGTTSPNAHSGSSSSSTRAPQYGSPTPHTNRLKALYRDLEPLPLAPPPSSTPLPDFSSTFLANLRPSSATPSSRPPTSSTVHPLPHHSTCTTSHTLTQPAPRSSSAPAPPHHPQPTTSHNAPPYPPAPSVPAAIDNLRTYLDSMLLNAPPTHTPSLQPPPTFQLTPPFLPTPPPPSTTYMSHPIAPSHLPPFTTPSWPAPSPSLTPSLLLSTPSLLAHEDTTSLARLILAKAAAQLQYAKPAKDPANGTTTSSSTGAPAEQPDRGEPGGNSSSSGGNECPPAGCTGGAPASGSCRGQQVQQKEDVAAGQGLGSGGAAGAASAIAPGGQHADADADGSDATAADGQRETWGRELAGGTGVEEGLQAMVEDRVVCLAVKRRRLRQWARAAVHGRVLGQQLVHHMARNRLGRWLRAWQRVVVEGAAAVEVQSFLLERAKDAKRQQVADQFRRMWLLYCSVLRWRVWLKEQQWQAAQQQVEVQRHQAEALEVRKLDAAAQRFRSTLLLHRGLRGWCWHVVQQRRVAEQVTAAAGDGQKRTARVEAFLSKLGKKKAPFAAGVATPAGRKALPVQTPSDSSQHPAGANRTYTMVEVYPDSIQPASPDARQTSATPCTSQPAALDTSAAAQAAANQPGAGEQQHRGSTQSGAWQCGRTEDITVASHTWSALQQEAVPSALQLAELLEQGLGSGGWDSEAAAAAMQLLCTALGQVDEQDCAVDAAAVGGGGIDEGTHGTESRHADDGTTSRDESTASTVQASSSHVMAQLAADIATGGHSGSGCPSDECCQASPTMHGEVCSRAAPPGSTQHQEPDAGELLGPHAGSDLAMDTIDEEFLSAEMGDGEVLMIEEEEEQANVAAAAARDCWDSSRDLEDEVDLAAAAGPSRPARATTAGSVPGSLPQAGTRKAASKGAQVAELVSSDSLKHYAAVGQGDSSMAAKNADAGAQAGSQQSSGGGLGSSEAGGDDRLDQQEVSSADQQQSTRKTGGRSAKTQELMRKRYADVQARREAHQAAARAAKEQAEREQLAAERLRVLEAKKKQEQTTAARAKRQALITQLQLLADLHYAKHLLTRWGLWRLQVAAAAGRGCGQAAEACCRRQALKRGIAGLKLALWHRRHRAMVMQVQRIGMIAQAVKASALASCLGIWWRWSRAAAMGRRAVPYKALQAWQAALQAGRQAQQVAVRHWNRTFRKAFLRAWHIAADRQAADRLLQHLQAEHNATLVARCHALRRVLRGWHTAVDEERRGRLQEQRREQQWSKISGWLDEYRHQKEAAGTGGGRQLTAGDQDGSQLLAAYQEAKRGGWMGGAAAADGCNDA